MAKTFYTERDISNLAAQGITTIEVGDDVVITELGRELAFKLNIRLVKPRQNHPEDDAGAVLFHHVRAILLERLGDRYPPDVLDVVIRRVMQEMKLIS